MIKQRVGRGNTGRERRVRPGIARWVSASAWALVLGCGNGNGGQTGDELADNEVTRELRGTAQRLVVTGPESGAAARDNQDFGWRMFGLEATPTENAVLSPYSISVAAAMLSAGAQGQTLDEIRQALSFSAEGEAFHASHNRLLQALEARNRPGTEESNAQTLRISNDLWLRPDLRPTDAFLNVLSANYGAGVQLTRFDTHAEEARQAINAKVADDTEQLIDELLPERSIQNRDDTAFVLTNATYFKARWLHEFYPTSTANAAFEQVDGTSVQVPMMNTEAAFAYRATDEYVAVALPYAGRELELVAIMPSAGTFESFVADLDGARVSAIRAGLGSERLALDFPKFEISTRLPLEQHLKTLGMQRAFTPLLAEFGLIDDRTNIRDAFHDAVIILDEEGTEAAAATAFVAVVVSEPPPPVPVRFDRPFVFYVRDVASDATLFIGQFVAP